MNTAKAAVKHLRSGGTIQESLEIALGRRSLSETPASQQTQNWFLPNQDALNRAVLILKNKLPDASVSVAPSNKGSGGYELTVSGTYMDQDVASIVAHMGGVFRLDNFSGMDLKR